MKLFNDIIKGQPDVADVHVPTNLDETDPAVDSPDFEDADDVVQIYVTKDGGITGFDGRRLEPVSDALLKMPLSVAKASVEDLAPGRAASIVTTLINRKSFVTKSVPIERLSFFDGQVHGPSIEKAVRDLDGGALEQPIVEKIGDEDCVIYGSAAVLARWLNGEDQVAVKYCDAAELRKRDDALEVRFEIKKAVPDQQLIFGWASVVTKKGKPIVDKQGHVIPVPELEKAFYDYVLNDRAHGHMHTNVGTGRLVECMVFTKEKQDLLKMDLGFEGAWVGYLVDDPKVWEAHKRGELPEFSIGGSAVHEPM